MKTIVVGYDGSTASAVALDHALWNGAEVHVVHVCPEAPPSLAPPARRALQERHDADGHHVLDELHGLPVTTRLERGAPAQALARVAEELDADEILVGGHGLGPVSALLGSVSHALLRASDRPVLVFPPPCVERRRERAVGSGETAFA